MEMLSNGGTVLSSASSDKHRADLVEAGKVPEQKPYFDPTEGCYVRVLPGGKIEKGELSAGPDGFCLVQFPKEPPFSCQVPNLWLETQAKGKGASEDS